MKFTLAKLISGLATAGILTASVTTHAAGTAAFSVSSTSATVGSNASVAVYENGTSENAVEVTFTSTSQLQFVADGCAGAFSSSAASSSSSITCFIPGGNAAVSGTNEVAILTFKAVSAGSAGVTVTGAQIDGGGVNSWNGASASGAVSVTTPVAPKTPSNPTTGGTTKKTGSTTTGSQGNTKGATGSTGTSNSTSTTNNNPKSTGSSNGTKSTAVSVKGASTDHKLTNKSTKPTTDKTHHTGLVTSSVLGMLIIAAGLYWFFFHKRTETAPAVYKLDNNTKSKSKAKTAAKSNRTNVKSTSVKAAKSTTTKK